MRLSGKLIFALTLALTLLAPSACSETKFDFLLDGTKDIHWGSNKITFATKDDRTLFLETIGNGVVNPKDFTVTFASSVANATCEATLANRAKVSLKQLTPDSVNNPFQVTLSLSTVNPGTVKPTFSKSPITIGEIARGASGALIFTKPGLSGIYQLEVPSVSGVFDANLQTEFGNIHSILNRGGFYNHHFIPANGPMPILLLAKTLATGGTGVISEPAAPNTVYCYRLEGDREFCVNHVSVSDITVTIKPAHVGIVDIMLKRWALPPLIVLLVAVFGGLLISHVFCLLDPIGYQAGKDASSLPEFVKYFLPEAEGFDSEGVVSDEDGSSLRIDPSSGKRVRTTREGRVLTGEDDPEPIEDETTDAFGVSVTAALLLVPFLF